MNIQANPNSCPFGESSRLLPRQANAHDAPRGGAGTQGRLNFLECSDCEAAWQWPLARSAADSVKIFSGAYLQEASGTYFDPEIRQSVAMCQANFIETNVRSLPGKLLDIGCGDGIFAREMFQRGWNVTGLDPALPSVIPELRNERGGRLLLAHDIASCRLEDPLFDIVVLLDVIEHVEYPMELVSMFSKHLRPNGTFVVETGNYQSDGRIDGGENWWNYQLDHRWYFAPPQLRQMAESAGLLDVRFAERVLRPWWKPSSSPSVPTYYGLLKTILNRPWELQSAIQAFRLKKRASIMWAKWRQMEIVTMLAQRPLGGTF